MLFFFFKQKTAYEMRISDWSSDVCSSDLQRAVKGGAIIVGQLDQTGFLDEAAQLYEMARALASGHDPSSRIGAARGGFKPVPCLRQFALRLHRCRQCVGQPCD